MPIAGRRDTKILIQSPSWSTNGLGERSASWATTATEWGFIRYPGGREAERVNQIAAETELIAVIQYSSNTSGINAEDRLKIGTTQYDILKVLPKPGGRPTTLEIFAKSRLLDESV